MRNEDSLSLRHTPITRPSVRRHPPPWHLSTTGSAEVPRPSETAREKGQKRGGNFLAYPVQTLETGGCGRWREGESEPSGRTCCRLPRTSLLELCDLFNISSGYSFSGFHFQGDLRSITYLWFSSSCSLLPLPASTLIPVQGPSILSPDPSTTVHGLTRVLDIC